MKYRLARTGHCLNLLLSIVMCVLALPAAAVQLTPEDLNGFVDGQIAHEMKGADISAMAVSVVKDGEVVLLKGYGIANHTGNVPVDPHNTVFPIGSVSKTFTALAVMRLVEAGKLNLDQDVNRYLDFRIEPAFGSPVTLRQLLTHTAGFEDTVKGLVKTNRAAVAPLRAYLVEHQPKRIFPPGTVMAYSNYGFTLAGYIVERVSGVPYADFMRREILSPLGMRNSSFEQPPPLEPDAVFARSYTEHSVIAQPYEYMQLAPAGSLSTTAEDMTRYMIAQLEGGSVSGRSVFRPETLAVVQARQFDPGTSAGVALSWGDSSINGRRVLSHVGATQQYLAHVVLVPAEHFGVFLVQNSRADGEFLGSVVHALLDRYFPKASAGERAAAPVGEVDPGITGVYERPQRNESSITWLFSLIEQCTVTEAGHGVITLSAAVGSDGLPIRWERTAPYVYHGGDNVIRFRTDSRGRVVSLIALEESQKIPVWRHAKILAGVLLIAAGILVVLIPRMIRSIWRSRATQQRLPSAVSRRIDCALLLCTACALVATVSWPAVLAYAGAHLQILDARLDPILRLLQGLGAVAAIGVPVAMYKAGWIRKHGANDGIGFRAALLIAVALWAITGVAGLTHFFSLSLRY